MPKGISMPFRPSAKQAFLNPRMGAGNQAIRPLRFEQLESRRLLFKPNTHLETGLDVLDDIQDGTITIEGQSLAVDSRIVDALKNHPAFYKAGVIGPDGFPDLIMGQSVIHPVNTGRWLEHVLDK